MRIKRRIKQRGGNTRLDRYSQYQLKNKICIARFYQDIKKGKLMQNLELLG